LGQICVSLDSLTTMRRAARPDSKRIFGPRERKRSPPYALTVFFSPAKVASNRDADFWLSGAPEPVFNNNFF
jgi:hypothetical protein